MDIGKLRGTALFSGLSEEEAAEALKELFCYERSYESGETILSAGTVTNVFGLVEEGSVTIENNDFWGNRTILAAAQAGEYFAETYAMLPGEVLLVDVRANDHCRILLIRANNLRRFFENAPAAGARKRWHSLLLQNLLRISLRKNLALSGRSFHTAPKSARGRVMSYLNAVSLQKDAAEFDLPFDRQQMADYLNLDRTALSKELGRMRDDGILRFHKNHFCLLPTHVDNSLRHRE